MNDNLICDKDCIKDLRPYEKCIALGEQSLTDTELIAAIIKTGVSGKPAGELAKDILDKSHNKVNHLKCIRITYSYGVYIILVKCTKEYTISIA